MCRLQEAGPRWGGQRPTTPKAASLMMNREGDLGVVGDGAMKMSSENGKSHAGGHHKRR